MGTGRSEHQMSMVRVAKDSLVMVVGFVYVDILITGPLDIPQSGEEVFVDRIVPRLGGIYHTAHVFQTMGCRSFLYFPAGQGVLDGLVGRFLSEQGITFDTWPASDDPSISLVVIKDGDRSFISYADEKALVGCPGFCGSRKPSWIHVGDVKSAFPLMAKIVEAKSQGIPISVSGCWAPEALIDLAKVGPRLFDLIVLNEKEAACIDRDRQTLFQTLRRAASNVVVTRGKDGAVGIVRGQYVTAIPAEESVIDNPTGGGDAFCAGMIQGLLAGGLPQEIIDSAQRVATDYLLECNSSRHAS